MAVRSGSWVEGGVVDGGVGLEVEDEDGDFGAADEGEDGGGEGVGGDVEEEEVDFFAAAAASGGAGGGDGVDQAELEDVDAGAGELRGDAGQVRFQVRLEVEELGPVGIESEAGEGDFKGVGHGFLIQR